MPITVRSLRLGTVGAGNYRLQEPQFATRLDKAKARAASGRGPARSVSTCYLSPSEPGHAVPRRLSHHIYFFIKCGVLRLCSQRFTSPQAAAWAYHDSPFQGRPPQSSAAAAAARRAEAPVASPPLRARRPDGLLRHDLPRFCRAARLAAAASALLLCGARQARAGTLCMDLTRHARFERRCHANATARVRLRDRG